MIPNPTMTQPRTTAADLATQGFSPAQIARLEALAQRYPLIEFLDTEAKWQHLIFLRWRVATRHLPED